MSIELRRGPSSMGKLNLNSLQNRLYYTIVNHMRNRDQHQVSKLASFMEVAVSKVMRALTAYKEVECSKRTTS